MYQGCQFNKIDDKAGGRTFLVRATPNVSRAPFFTGIAALLSPTRRKRKASPVSNIRRIGPLIFERRPLSNVVLTFRTLAGSNHVTEFKTSLTGAIWTSYSAGAYREWKPDDQFRRQCRLACPILPHSPAVSLGVRPSAGAPKIERSNERVLPRQGLAHSGNKPFRFYCGSMCPWADLLQSGLV
jgi:hypothetical protein